MCANRMDDRMHRAIMTIDRRQLASDIVPFFVGKPWNMPRATKINSSDARALSSRLPTFRYDATW